MIIQYPSSSTIRAQTHISTLAERYDQILADIRTKHLTGLGEPFIAYHLEHYLRTNPKARKRIHLPKYTAAKEYMALLKYIRQKAHPTIGVFQKKEKSKDAKNKKKNNQDKAYTTTKTRAKTDNQANDDTLLATHLSTKERLPHYDQLKQTIAAHIGNTPAILDIGAGLNPLAYKRYLTGVRQYDTIEVHQQLCELHDTFFAKTTLRHNHHLTHLPIYYPNVLPGLPSYDLVLALKVLDPLEEQKRHTTVKMLTMLKTRWLLASFSLATIKGNAMDRTQAGWFEKVIRQLGYRLVKTTRIGDELYYIIECTTSTKHTTTTP